jgi:hypothetical protein
VERRGFEKCSHAVSCTGGCFAVNYLETGCMFKPGPKMECAFTSMTVELAAEYGEEFAVTVSH